MTRGGGLPLYPNGPQPFRRKSARYRAMAHSGGHAVLVSGTPGDLAAGELVGAFHAAGHRPLAVGFPPAAAGGQRCYVTFHEAAEADLVCRHHGAIRIRGRALQVTRLFGVGWGPEVGAGASSDDERSPWPPLLPARRAAMARRPAAGPGGPSGPLNLDALAPRCSTGSDRPGPSRLGDHPVEEVRPPRPDIPWSEAAARGEPPAAPATAGDVRAGPPHGHGAAVGGPPLRPSPPPPPAAAPPRPTGTAAGSCCRAAPGATPSARPLSAGRRVTFDADPAAARAGAHAAAHTAGPAAAYARPRAGTASGAPPPPQTVPPDAQLAPPGPVGAGPAVRAAAGPADPLLAALRPLLRPHPTARDGLVILRIWGLRFHEEYYGIYMQVGHHGRVFEGHITVLHCEGCLQRLSPDQVRRVEARCRGLRGRPVPLAHTDMVLVWRAGHVHRGWCTIHTGAPLSHALWTVRGFLSNWIPAATSLENRGNFHLSFDLVVG